jgi:hypothetical protein
MQDNFRFTEITTLFNKQATKNNIQQAFSSYRNTGKEDGIFIFFAGHGHTETTPDGDLGYIIPHDGSMNEMEMFKNISMNELKDLLKPIPAKHAFVVVDACYSGTLLATRGAQTEPETDLSYFKEITRGRVRQVLTAGSKNQTVLDDGPGGHSVFTGYFLRYLENASSYITASQLGFKVPKQVYSIARERGVSQVPQFGNIIGEGDFVFISSKTQSPSTPVINKPIEKTVSGTGSYYITTIPEGAEVWIDGMEIAGITPLLVDDQLVGEHTIYVEKGDYSPEIAANNAQPTTFTCIKPPGNRDNQGASPVNKFSDNFVLNNISPIHTNNGKAVKVHEELVPHIVVAIASPTGLVVNINIPIDETPIILIATQTPDPRKNNRIDTKKIVKNNSGMF